MPKSENQKLKLYTILQILKEETDEEHYISMPKIIAALNRRGFKGERKSVGDDIKTINESGIGYEIEFVRNHGYRLSGRLFQNEELSMLADIIGSSRFITQKKSDELIDKLCTEASRYERPAIKSRCTEQHVKMENESIYYNLNAVQAAMDENRQISFTYHRYNAKKEFVEAHPGKIYTISPWELIWNEKTYYMIGVSGDGAKGGIRNFRLDRMRNVCVADKARVGKDLFANANKGEYENKSFGMFGGEDCLVTLHCKEEAAGVIIDRFGKLPTFLPLGEGAFKVSVHVFLSPQFYAWLCGLSGIVTLAYPQKAIDGYRAHLEGALQNLSAQDAKK